MNNTQSNQTPDTEHKLELCNLEIFRYKVIKHISLKPAIDAGYKKLKILKLIRVTECVDKSTGEIIPFHQAEKVGFRQGINFGVFVLQRETILNSLRKEVRAFAVFVLKFRNQRGGITPDVDELCKMYAELHGMRLSNVKRYVERLKEAGVLSSKYLVGPLFQIHNKKLAPNEHLAEDIIASNVYDSLRVALKT